MAKAEITIAGKRYALSCAPGQEARLEELGAEANGHCAELKVVQVPLEVEWTIETSGGIERVNEAHRVWN